MHANSASHVCPTCGSGLEHSGECHACLLQLGLSHSGGESQQPGDTALPTLDELNAQFPQLEITRLVGRGGMGAIYHACQTALDRDVALKLIGKGVSSDPAFVERFEREAKTLAKLSHPNIVTIFDFGRTSDGTAYLILEYVDGINLREAISNGDVGADEALEVVSTICGALEYAHSKGVVHRDIKPENILLGEDGTLKVADFGIAKMVDDSGRAPTLTASRQVLGSLHYLAPEQLEAPDQVDHRVDLYALGVVFYELLTGQLPLGRYEAPSKLRDRVDQRLDPIVLKTLSRKPRQRYQNAAELDSDIGEVATSMKERLAAPASGQEPTSYFAPSASVSVPFTCEATDGWGGEAVGGLHVRGDTLCAEFRTRNMWGSMSSKTHFVEIPRRHLTRIELLPGFLGARLVVSADSISALGALPNAETGRVELKVKRSDEGCARELPHALGFDAIQIVDRQVAGGPIHWPNTLSDEQRLVYGLLMILCGILNAGGLAIYEVMIVSHLTGPGLVSAVIAGAVLMGSTAALQLLTGILNLCGSVRLLSLTTAVCSMVPLSPIWLISFPTSVWVCRMLTKGQPSTRHGKQTAPSATRGAKKNWGTTTLAFIRESRWATMTGVLNVAAAAAVIGALAAFKFGYYPAEMRYRIVDTDVGRVELDAAVQARLEMSGGFRGTDYNHASLPTILTVKTWQSRRHRVEELLSVQEVPQLVWLEPTGGTGGTGEDNRPKPPDHSIPVVSGIDTSSLRTSELDLGTVVYPVANSIELSSEFVSSVSAVDSVHQIQLIVKLTSGGRGRLAPAGGTSAGGLGLVIDGLVEGIATKESISQKRIVFQLSRTSRLTSDGIVAGMRGPTLPTPLEWLK